MPILTSSIAVGETATAAKIPCGGGLIVGIGVDAEFDGTQLTLANGASTTEVASEAGVDRAITIGASKFCQIDPPVRAPELFLVSDAAQVGTAVAIEVHTL